jgi:5-methylcytosine-specific restriction endonuclease McrA
MTKYYYRGMCGNHALTKKQNKLFFQKSIKQVIRKINIPYGFNSKLNFIEHIHSYYGLEYIAYEQLIDRNCMQCGSKIRLHLHHKLPKSQGGTNEIDNLTTLCEPCHLKAHNKKQWK